MPVALLNMLIGAVNALPYIAVVVVGLLAYNSWIENPAIKREARSGYVLEATTIAAQAEANEARRQRDVAERTRSTFERQLKEANDRADAIQADADMESDRYEAENAAKNKPCVFDKSRLDFVLGRSGTKKRR